MKLSKKISILSLGAAMALGVGIAAVGGISAAVETKAVDTLVDTWDFTTKSSSSQQYITEWVYDEKVNMYGAANNNGGWAYVRVGGKSSHPTKISTMSNITAYADPLSKLTLTALTIQSGSGFTMDSVVLTVYSDATLETLLDTVDGGTVALSMSWVPTTGTTWPANSFYKLSFNWSCTSSSNRGMHVEKIELFKDAPEVKPTSVTVGLEASEITAIGGSSQATATVLPENATYKDVTWTSSDPLVARIDSATGLISAISNGTVTITAQCVGDTSITNTAQLTVSGADANKNDKLITGANLGMVSSYEPKATVYGFDGIAYEGYNVMKNSSTDSIQMRGSDPFSYLKQVTPFPATIDKIHLVTTNTVETFEVKVGTGAASISTVLTPVAAVNNVYSFDVSSVGSFTNFEVARTASSNTCYFKILVELQQPAGSDLFNAKDWASGFLNATGPECTALSIQEATWTTLSTSYAALSEGAKAFLKGETLEVTASYLQLAVQRYDYIIAKYTTLPDFMLRAAAPAAASPLLVGQNINTMIIVLSITSFTIVALGTTFLVIKRRKHN